MRKARVLAFWLFACSFAHAEEIHLFNGKDLSGWTYFIAKSGSNADGHMKLSDAYTVKDGSIHVVGKPFGYLRTVNKYTNYRVQVDWRWEDLKPARPNNSGLFLSMSGADRLWPLCYEVEMADDGKNNVGDLWVVGYDKPSFKTDPALYVETPPSMEGNYGFSFKDAHRGRSADAQKPAGEWNTWDVTIDEGHILVKLNGKVVNEGTGAEIVPGYFGLQAEGAPVEFRNIKLTPIVH